MKLRASGESVNWYSHFLNGKLFSNTTKAQSGHALNIAILLLRMYSKDIHQKVHRSTIQNNLQTRNYPMDELSQWRLIWDWCTWDLEEGKGHLAKFLQDGSS